MKSKISGIRVVSVAEQDRMSLNSLPVCGDFCRLLITFASSLDQDQAWQDVGNDLDPKSLTTLCGYSGKNFLKIEF